MDKAFYTRIHYIRLYALVETLLVICIGSFPLIAIAARRNDRLLSVSFLISSVFAGVFLFLLTRKKREIGICRLPIRSNCLQDLVESLRAKELFDNTYYSFLNQDNVSIRVLLQYTQSDDAENIKKNRRKANLMINKIHHVPEEMPLEEVAHTMRINMRICETANDEISQWLLRDANMLLSRSEIILNMAIVLDEHIASFPECTFGTYFSEIHRYCAAVKAIEMCLGTTAYDKRTVPLSPEEDITDG